MNAVELVLVCILASYRFGGCSQLCQNIFVQLLIKVHRLWQYFLSKSALQYFVPQFSCLLTPSRLSQNNNIILGLLVGWFITNFACSLLVTVAGGSPM